MIIIIYDGRYGYGAFRHYFITYVEDKGRIPERTGRSTPSHPHPGRWQTSLRTGSHFWLFLPPDHACLQSGRWRCPSGASRHGPEHTCAGKRTSGYLDHKCVELKGSNISMCRWYLQLSGVKSFIDFLDFWHVVLTAPQDEMTSYNEGSAGSAPESSNRAGQTRNWMKSRREKSWAQSSMTSISLSFLVLWVCCCCAEV